MTARRWLSGAAIVAALVAAGVVVATAPDNDGITAPFLVHGGIGEPVSGRTLTAVVTDVALTDHLDIKYNDAGDTSTDGVWVVVDTVLTARIGTVSVSDAELWIGDVRYGASDILPAPTPLQLSYGADIPQQGSLVFEIPLSALDEPGAARASIVFFDVGDTRLDSFPAVVVDLTTLEISPRIRIDERVVVEK